MTAKGAGWPARLPRALRGHVMAMAGRPPRPASEAQAVRAAAAEIHASTGQATNRALGQEIARRVIAALLADASDPAASLPGLIDHDPILILAFSPEIGTIDTFASKFRDRMLANFGASIPPLFQQEAQRRATAREMQSALASRYTKCLRQQAE